MTVAALLTGKTRAAVAVIAISGPDADAIVSAGFQPASSRRIVVGEIRYGTWQTAFAAEAPSNDASLVPPGESVVVVCCSDQNWELHCHGGAAAVQRILDDLAILGATIVSAEQAWQRCQTMPSPSGLACEIVVALSQAPSQRTAAYLLNQLTAGLAAWGDTAWGDSGPSLTRRVGMGESRPTTDASGSVITDARLELLRQDAARALDNAAFGLHLTQPWRVVIAGPPNVGKSSLINALVGFDRSIAFDQPGTTRDVLEVQTVIDGWPIRLSDTAGLRHDTDSPIESAGIALAAAEIAAADLILWVHDASQPGAVAIPEVVTQSPLLVVLNKIDRCQGGHATPVNTDRQYQTLETSAVSLIGIDALRQAMVDRLIGQPPPLDALVPVTQRQVDWLQRIAAAESISQARDALTGLAAG